MRACAVAFAGLSFVAAGCGSSPTTSSDNTSQSLAQGPGQQVALTPGDADFAPGPIRFTFLVIARNGRPISKPTAAVTLARGADAAPLERATARLEPIGVPGVSTLPFGVPSIYVVHLHPKQPGTYFVRAQPAGARIEGIGNIVVRAHTASPPVGAKAIASNTPTLATTHGKLGPLTTATHPDRALYTTSIATALARHEPFVVAFATPKFCSSRTCGPVVDVVSYVRKRTPGTTFIHVEVYRDNDPAKGYNRWMRQWGLESEPWVFVVGRDGRIKAKFEGSVSAGELAAALR